MGSFARFPISTPSRRGPSRGGVCARSGCGANEAANPARTARRFMSDDLTAVALFSGDPDSQASRQFLGELPGDAAGTRAAGGRPFQRFAFEFGICELDPEMLAIAFHHGEVFILAAAMKAEPQAEAVGQRDFFLDRLAGIDRGGALVL